VLLPAQYFSVVVRQAHFRLKVRERLVGASSNDRGFDRDGLTLFLD
jgi:hypothetical protein